MAKRLYLFGLLALAAAPALAQERDFCADRPGRGTPACTLDPGRVQAEASFADWTLDRQPDSRTDTLLFGDLLLRAGLTEHIEAQAAWTPYGRTRVRDRATGGVERQGGAGDLALGFRASLRNPDGSGTSIAVQPTVTLPTGGRAIGAGTWGARLLVPASLSLSDAVQLALTPEVDAAPDEDRDGRHLAYGGVVGVGFPLASGIDAGIELSGFHDEDPSGHSTQWFLDWSAAWQPPADRNLQFDIGTAIGLNHSAPDFQLYAGIARRF